jgi:hypothetical protein
MRSRMLFGEDYSFPRHVKLTSVDLDPQLQPGPIRCLESPSGRRSRSCSTSRSELSELAQSGHLLRLQMSSNSGSLMLTLIASTCRTHSSLGRLSMSLKCCCQNYVEVGCSGRIIRCLEARSEKILSSGQPESSVEGPVASKYWWKVGVKKEDAVIPK